MGIIDWVLANSLRNAKEAEPSESDAVFFGAETTAKIVSIEEDTIRYLDSNGSKHEIALKACARKGEVGYRFLDEPPWTVVLFDPASTRMEFESYEMAYERLLNPLGQNGWHTLDCT